MDARSARRAAVVGAGPAGCAAACALARGGRRVALFEREPAVGGRTRSLRGEGFVLDTGAGFFTNFYPRLQGLVRELGIEAEVVELARLSGLVHAGAVAPLDTGSLRSFLRFPHLSWREKLRFALYAARATARRGRIDLADPDSLAALDDRSAADEARRAVGENAYQFLIRPGVEPFWYFRCEEISRGLLVALLANASGARFFTFRGGMDVLCQHLAARAELRAGCAVEALAAAADGRTALRFRSPTGEVHEERFDEVVVATPAPVAAQLVAGLPESRVAPAQRAFLASQRYAANVHASFWVKSGGEPPRYDNLLPCGPGDRPIAALAFQARKHPAAHGGRELVSAYVGGAAAHEILALPVAERAGAIWQRARAFHPALPAEAEPFASFERPEAIPIPAVGRYREAARFGASQRGPLVFAGDHLGTPTIESAIHTGQQAARRLLEA